MLHKKLFGIKFPFQSAYEFIHMIHDPRCILLFISLIGIQFNHMRNADDSWGHSQKIFNSPHDCGPGQQSQLWVLLKHCLNIVNVSETNFTDDFTLHHKIKGKFRGLFSSFYNNIRHQRLHMTRKLPCRCKCSNDGSFDCQKPNYYQTTSRWIWPVKNSTRSDSWPGLNSTTYEGLKSQARAWLEVNMMCECPEE